MTTRPFDHFIYAARDLEPMCRAFEDLSGVKPGPGGSHPGLGTRNALASLGDSVYLEFLATDPAQPSGGTLADPIRSFTIPRLFSYMVRTGDLELVQQQLAKHGIESDLFGASRSAPDGSTLRWRLLFPRQHRFGELVPRFIDWMDTRHPATTSVAGCRFESFEVGHPDAAALAALLRDLETEIRVQTAEQPYLRLTIGTPRGSLVLGSDVALRRQGDAPAPPGA